ncbi:ATPase, histidine kinase-, DNA gyrase B-, and HSP90-like domain protein [Verrucomicrobiia bacterium DG1235]|nr:ATPase, histidine kinase-, DNA gyrase B-, and HSP90-like domain protein [Verrucomicrobiae bacterium DG1235]
MPRPCAEDWLEEQLAKIPDIAATLAVEQDADELMRKSVMLARERLGFARIGIWLLKEESRTAVGTFGVSGTGEVIDERELRFYDNSGYIRSMRSSWERSPHYYLDIANPLRSGELKVLGYGTRITVPLIHKGAILGFIAVDDLIKTDSVNRRSGTLLRQFALVVSNAYSTIVLEDEVRRSAEKAAESERIKSEFLGMMGHEVRTPLNAMMGYAQLLRMRERDAEVVEIANTIEECGAHMSGLIDSILEYSHLEAGNVERWYKPGDPIEVVESTVKGFELLYAGKGLGLEVAHEGDRLKVDFDAVSLRQVLSNLLQNALKYSERGGTRVKILSKDRAKGFVEYYIEVRDSGIGIASKHLAAIFEPFRQIGRSEDKKSGGVGMGLAIVKSLVKGMGGEIRCESVKGEGTTFSVVLSFRRVKSEEGNSGAVSNGAGLEARSPKRILIVEDNSMNLGVLNDLVECLGYANTDFAKDGIEARDMLRERPYDIVFMDVQMPRLDGLSLTRLIRDGGSCPINRTVPIVGVTAFTSEYDREECMMAGMNDYISKPVVLDSLRRAFDLV